MGVMALDTFTLDWNCSLPPLQSRVGQNLMPLNKVVASADEAVRDIQDGATIMVGGFGLCGIPENLIAGVSAQRRQEPEHHQQQRGRR